MSEKLIRWLFLVLFMHVCVVFTGPISLANKTNRNIEFSFKFFHPEAKQKMVISWFPLAPYTKTRFPRKEDEGRAIPLTLKVRRADDPASTIATKFLRNDDQHKINVVQRNGDLIFDVPKT